MGQREVPRQDSERLPPDWIPASLENARA